MKTEIMQRYDELLFWLNSECPSVAPPLEPYDTSDLSHNFCELLRIRIDEILALKSQLSEAGEEKRCATCKWFKIGHGRCVWCLRNTPWNYEEFLKTSGYVDNWQPR